MNMKKLLSGTVAATLAISALATTAFAEATSETYELHKYQWRSTYSKSATGYQDVTLTPTAGDITLTFGEDNIEKVSGTVKIANTTDETVRTEDVVFEKQTDEKVFSVSIVSGSGLIDEDELAFATDEYIDDVKLTIESEKIDVADKDATTLAVTIDVAGTATNIEAFEAFETLTELTGTPVQEKTYTLVNETEVTLLSEIYDNNGKIDKAFVQHANNFFQGAENGRVVIEFAPNVIDADTDGSLTDPDLPNQDITLGDTTVTAKDFGLALNWETTGKLVQATDIVDNKVSFDWETLVSAMGGMDDFAGNITSMSYIFHSIPAELNGYDLVSISYIKNEDVTDGSTEEETTTEDEDVAGTTEGTTNDDNNDDEPPQTGSAPVALALIPVALAAAVIVAKKVK